MLEPLEKRACQLAVYIIETGATVRAAARHFGISKSTVHKDLQQRLLDALAGHVTGDGRVLGLAGNLVDLVDIDDAALRFFHVVIGVLDEFEQDVFDVLADVACLR